LTFLFGSLQVAEIAAGAMNDYLLMEHMLKVHVIEPENVKPNL
jgi:nucleolar protein 15